MTANSKEIVIKKGNIELKFDSKVKTSIGFLFVIKFVCAVPLEAVFSGVTTRKPMTADKAHGLLTHFVKQIQEQQLATWKCHCSVAH